MVTKKDKLLAAAQKFLERGSLDKAVAEFGKAVAEDPKDTRTWLRIAELHVKEYQSVCKQRRQPAGAIDANAG